MNQDLRGELLRRANVDQSARAELDFDGNDWKASIDQLSQVDADNTAWLSRVISASGWPGRSEVGEDGAEAAWLLAQHADADLAFQERCLDLLTAAAASAEASLSAVAYLTDRVLLARGEPQLYGTQMQPHRDGWRIRDLADPATADDRRAEMGLVPLAEQLAQLEADAGPPQPSPFTCPECHAAIRIWRPEPGEREVITCPACAWTATVHRTPRGP